MAKGQKKTAKLRQFTNAEMAEALEGLMPLLVQSGEINEAFTRADLELALDDRGWINPNSMTTFGEIDPATRKQLTTRARMYWHRDPLAHQAVRLWTDYGVGDGFSYNCTDKGVMQKLNKFCKSRANRSVLSSRAVQKLSRKLLVDGELFFAIFGEPEADDKKIRTIDTLQITDRICDPDDDDHVIAYRRVNPTTNKTLYYLDWTAAEEDRATAEAEIKKKFNEKTITWADADTPVVIYHLPFDDFGWRGNGLLIPALDWSRENRRFMEARVAITQALSKFAHKLTMKGGQALVDQMRKRIESSHTQTGGTTLERNPQPASASTWLQNAGVDLQPTSRVTGAGDAKQDGDSLKLMVCAATNIMLHYFGDPSTGNLATATAMELPMLKSFTAYQKLWLEGMRDIFRIVLNEQDGDKEAVIDVDLPPILKDDLRNLGTAIQAISQVFPEIAVDEVLQAMLIALGINNVEDVMDSIRAKRKENDAKDKARQDAMSKLLGQGTPAKPGQQQAPPLAPNLNLSNESMSLLTDALLRVAGALNVSEAA